MNDARPVFAREMAILGYGLWTAGYAAPSAYVARAHDPGVKEPRADLLPTRLRRRTSLLTRMAAEVVGQAIAGAGVQLADLAIVFGSVYGEIQATVELLAQMVDEPGALLSPTKFHNSVHNTATGYLSIATGSHVGSTAIGAGPSTLAYGLVEAATTLDVVEGPVLLVIGEESLPPPLAGASAYPPLAAALLLGAPGRSPGRPRIRLLQIESEVGDREIRPLPAAPAGLADNPCAPVLGLVESLTRGDRGACLVTAEGSLPVFAVDLLGAE